MTEFVLHTHALTKRFGERIALDGLDLDISAGEVYCLLGANGAGKTTAINLLLGFLKPDGGVARIVGTDPASPAARRQVAYIPEQVVLYPQLSGLENLRYFAGLAGPLPGPAALLECLKSAGLPEDAVHQRLTNYSKGMRQKVGIAIALAKRAKLLLLDEPLSGLDPSAANEFVRLVQSLALRGTAALIATHDLFRAKQLASRIGILKGGCKLEELNAKDVDANQLETLYLKLNEA